MKKKSKKIKPVAPFDLNKWLARESANDKIMPRSYFADTSDHPFFKKKFEDAKAFFEKYPHP